MTGRGRARLRRPRRPPAARRSGFTLLELIVAITITGVVSLLVYGVARVAVQTQERLEERGLEVQQMRAWHTLIAEALRNAYPAPVRGDTAFHLVDEVDARGRPADRLRFLTAGSVPPLTPDADWEVILGSGPEGLTMIATPIGVAAPPRLIRAPPGLEGVDVRVRATRRTDVWTGRWRFPGTVPSAVELIYWTDGEPLMPPVRLWLPLGNR